MDTPFDKNYDWRCPDPLDVSLVSRLSLRDQVSESQSKVDEAPKELCKRCKRRVCFKPKLLASASYYGAEDIVLGTWEEVKARETCPFCRLVVAAVELGQNPNAIDDEEEVVLDWTIDKGYKINLALHGTYIGFVIDDYSDDNIKLWQAQAVEDDWLEPDKVCEWLNMCDEYHGEVCDPLVESTASKFDEPLLRTLGCVFRLIDTNKYCIVEDVKDPYIALSYVWGGVKGLQLKESNKEELLATNGLKAHWNEIPQTVRDAFSLVKRMGKRYLWVDALCLIQDSLLDVQIGVSMMNFVYGGASMTIIAAAGKDANADLPGVRFGTRLSNHVVEEVQPDLSMTVIQDMDIVLETTYYAERAWT